MPDDFVKRRMQLAALSIEDDLDAVHGPPKQEHIRSTRNGKARYTVRRFRSEGERKLLLGIDELVGKASGFGRFRRRWLPSA